MTIHNNVRPPPLAALPAAGRRHAAAGGGPAGPYADRLQLPARQPPAARSRLSLDRRQNGGASPAIGNGRDVSYRSDECVTVVLKLLTLTAYA